MAWSPSLRGRGLKCTVKKTGTVKDDVALFARAWIEIVPILISGLFKIVALFARAWIEINPTLKSVRLASVALFARAWIEIYSSGTLLLVNDGRPLCEGVD